MKPTPVVRQVHHDINAKPFIAIWEVTRACQLVCQHCRADAQHEPAPGQLTTEQGKALLDSIASYDKPRPIVVLTGGDPCERGDLGAFECRQCVAVGGRDIGPVAKDVRVGVNREKSQQLGIVHAGGEGRPFDIATCSSLSDAQRRRALHNLEHRLDGTVLTVSASTQRSQARNRAEARERMAALLREALAPPPPPRRRTKPTQSSVRRRLEAKKRRSELKSTRRRPQSP